jgi:long-chain acyl-CoA synthetase
MDIESSILPAPSPIGASTNPGVDDTYLFDGPHRPAQPSIEEHRPTLFPTVPAMLAALNSQVLRKSKHDLRSLKSCLSGGAALPLRVADEFREHTGCTVVEGYGLSEASPVTHAGPLDGNAVPGTIGVPLPDTDARIVDLTSGLDVAPGESGELVIRGPQVMRGYWNRPEATAEAIVDGWLRTGDVATVDGEGYFAIVDRRKDMINTAGFKVWPREVEEALYAHPAVRLAAVVGVPDDYRGEAVKAFVVLKHATGCSELELSEFLRARLTAYKVPRAIEFRAELPTSGAGKVLRRALRAE